MAKQAKRRRLVRMAVAERETGITESFLKKLINNGRLQRYKLGRITMVDLNQLDELAVKDAGNHGPSCAPQAGSSKP